MVEQLDLTTPFDPIPATNKWEVIGLNLQRKAATIVITLEGDGGDSFKHVISGATATSLIVALNKADLSSNSLDRRIIQLLIDDGVFAGTISGAPD